MLKELAEGISSLMGNPRLADADRPVMRRLSSSSYDVTCSPNPPMGPGLRLVAVDSCVHVPHGETGDKFSDEPHGEFDHLDYGINDVL